MRRFDGPPLRPTFPQDGANLLSPFDLREMNGCRTFLCLFECVEPSRQGRDCSFEGANPVDQRCELADAGLICEGGCFSAVRLSHRSSFFTASISSSALSRAISRLCRSATSWF